MYFSFTSRKFNHIVWIELEAWWSGRLTVAVFQYTLEYPFEVAELLWHRHDSWNLYALQELAGYKFKIWPKEHKWGMAIVDEVDAQLERVKTKIK